MESQLICACFFTDNIFLHRYRLHVSYHDDRQFTEEYRKVGIAIESRKGKCLFVYKYMYMCTGQIMYSIVLWTEVTVIECLSLTV